jgi:hypothetical protein
MIGLFVGYIENISNRKRGCMSIIESILLGIFIHWAYSSIRDAIVVRKVIKELESQGIDIDDLVVRENIDQLKNAEVVHHKIPYHVEEINELWYCWITDPNGNTIFVGQNADKEKLLEDVSEKIEKELIYKFL